MLPSYMHYVNKVHVGMTEKDMINYDKPKVKYDQYDDK